MGSVIEAARLHAAAVLLRDAIGDAPEPAAGSGLVLVEKLVPRTIQLRWNVGGGRVYVTETPRLRFERDRAGRLHLVPVDEVRAAETGRGWYDTSKGWRIRSAPARPRETASFYFTPRPHLVDTGPIAP